MTAAATIAILIALTVAIVRIAGDVMRLTGLPESIARFQALSALTGTGFTTGESELTVNYPLRRRVLIALMVIGHLGLVTLASTFIIALMNAQEGNRFVAQILLILGAVIVVFIITWFKPLYKLMCDLAEYLLIKHTKLRITRSKVLLNFDSNYSVYELAVADLKLTTILQDNLPREIGILGVRQSPKFEFEPFSTDLELKEEDVIILCSTESAFSSFTNELPPGQ